MDFTISDKQKLWRDRVARVYRVRARQQSPEKRWRIIPVLEELKQTAKAEGLWNLFLPPSAGRCT